MEKACCQTVLIFALGYTLAKVLKLNYENAAPAALIGASNHFEVAVATAVILFGLSSGAALAISYRWVKFKILAFALHVTVASVTFSISAQAGVSRKCSIIENIFR